MNPRGTVAARSARSAFAAGLMVALAARADPIDQLDNALTVSALHDQFRARLSGTLELEAYRFSAPAPGLIEADGTGLFNPRLVTFLDAQLGEDFYAFAQARVDRGFDPAAEELRARLDEYAVRFAPAGESWINVQLGQFATVVGNWVPRHGSWSNAFVTAPLAYENLTGIWDAAAARSAGTLLAWSHVVPRPAPADYEEDTYLQLPIIWGPSYGTGASISGRIDRFVYAFELKNAALSSRPSAWHDLRRLWQHPTVSSRIAWEPNETWTFGLSASTGPYLREEAQTTIAPGHAFGDYRETLFAQDVSFAWHHLQVWAEFFEARFAIPTVGDADSFAYYGEVRYTFAPGFSAAMRWNQQLFSDFPDGLGGRVPWSAEKWRIDLAPSFRFTAHVELKLQYSLEHNPLRSHELGHLLAAQLLIRF